VTVPDAPKILLSNVYDWFVRVERGVYALTDRGQAALIRWPQTVPINGIADATSHSGEQMHNAEPPLVRKTPLARNSRKAA